MTQPEILPTEALAAPMTRHVLLHAWRKSKGLTRRDLAELTGFSESGIVNFERGERRNLPPRQSVISEASWRKLGLACAAIEYGIEPLF